ncbi:hypothetical protein ACTXT7_017547, partial [Hymenolepis weldensis]
LGLSSGPEHCPWTFSRLELYHLSLSTTSSFFLSYACGTKESNQGLSRFSLSVAVAAASLPLPAWLCMWVTEESNPGLRAC